MASKVVHGYPDGTFQPELKIFFSEGY
ncbi:S-layer homology domain-containing protein [Desulfotruncus alcoholivorax]